MVRYVVAVSSDQANQLTPSDACVQQHGSVYWSADAERLLSTLDPSKGLADQLAPAAFTFQRCPIWQDSSTTRECKELEEAVGGPQVLADITGSRAYERFTGNQIRRVCPLNSCPCPFLTFRNNHSSVACIPKLTLPLPASPWSPHSCLLSLSVPSPPSKFRTLAV